MSSAQQPPEPALSLPGPFVGADRQGIVERIVARFDGVAAGQGPHLTVLVGPTGCGKTRVVQEVYRKLATVRQSAPPYWPTSIVRGASGDTLGSRKIIHPTNPFVAHGAVMRWLWWGVRADEDSAGSPMRALANHAPQLQAHIAGLMAAIELRKRDRELAAQALGALVGLLPLPDFIEIASSARAVLPSLWQRVRAGIEGRRQEATQRAAGGRQIESERGDPDDVVREFYGSLSGVLGADLPLVLVLDDAHWADAATVALTDRLMRATVPVLILATAWPDELSLQEQAETGAGDGQRTTFGGWLDAAVRTIPSRIETAALGRILDEDLAQIVLDAGPDSSPVLVQALVRRAEGNPLLLRHLLELPKVRQSVRGGAITLDPREVLGLPAGFRQILQEKWADLPLDVRLVLSQASLQGPMFSTDLVVATATSSPPAPRQSLDAAVHPYAWAQQLDTFLGEFTERGLYEVAREARAELFSATDLQGARGRIADFVSALTDDELNRFSPLARRLLLTVHVGVAEEIDEGLDLRAASASAMRLAGIAAATFDWSETVRAASASVRWRERLPATSDDDQSLADARALLGIYLSESGDYRGALEQWEQVVADKVRILGPDHPETLVARSETVLCHWFLGEHATAAEIGERLLVDYERVYGGEHPETLTVRSNLAGAFRDLGEHRRALELFERILEQSERVKGPEHLDTLIVKGHLATTHELLGNDRMALELRVQNLADRERILGAEHPSTVTARGNLALSYRAAGDLLNALAIGEQVVAEMERTRGPEHPHTLRTRRELAYVFEALGRYADAQKLCQRVLADSEKTLGSDHPETLLARTQLARSFDAVGDYRRSLDLWLQAAADRERVLGPDHPDTLAARSETVLCHWFLGEHATAAEIGERLLVDYERVYGGEHPETLTVRSNLAGAFRDLGEHRRALELFERILEQSERVKGPEHLDTLIVKGHLATTHELLGNDRMALELRVQNLADRERILGAEHPSTVTARGNLAVSYRAVGDLRHAVEIEERVLLDRERILGPEHPHTLVARESLARTYEDLGRRDAARALYPSRPVPPE